MPTVADAPLKKVTLNLYHDDVIKLQRLLGEGWSVTVRRWVHEHVSAMGSVSAVEPATVEDLSDD